MVEIESQYIVLYGGETVAHAKNDDDGLGLIQLEFGDGYGKGRHILTPEQAVAIANILIRKAKDMEEAANG
jgi:hypothetical protein